jgi:serine/threonine protein kinase
MESSEREDEYNRIKVCDFGLSQICKPDNGKAHMEVKMGTRGYIAPEV